MLRINLTNQQKLRYVSSLIIKHFIKGMYVDRIIKDKASNGNDRITYICIDNNSLEEKVIIVEIEPMFYENITYSNIIINSVPLTKQPHHMVEVLNKFVDDYEELIGAR